MRTLAQYDDWFDPSWYEVESSLGMVYEPAWYDVSGDAYGFTGGRADGMTWGNGDGFSFSPFLRAIQGLFSGSSGPRPQVTPQPIASTQASVMAAPWFWPVMLGGVGLVLLVTVASRR